MRELDGKMENLSLEVKDFEGAVKLQGAMMDKISAQRKSDPEEKGKEKKMTETQRAMLGSDREFSYSIFNSNIKISKIFNFFLQFSVT